MKNDWIALEKGFFRVGTQGQLGGKGVLIREDLK